MFLSEKRLVDRVISQSVTDKKSKSDTLKDLQIIYAFILHHYVAIAIICGAMVTIGMIAILDLSHKSFSLIWAFFALSLSAGLFFVSNYLAKTHREDSLESIQTQQLSQKSRLSVPAIHTYMFIASLLMGLILAVGLSGVLYYYGLSGSIHFIALGYFTLMFICQNIAVGVLAYRVEYFFTFFLTSISGFVLVLAQNPKVLFEPPYFYFYALAYVCYILAAGVEERRMRSRSLELYIDNTNLLKDTKDKQVRMIQTNKKLATEIKKRSTTEKLLQTTNAQLEQHVKQRTSRISQINQRLTHLNENLKLAQESAGMANWEWDAKKGRLVVADGFEPLVGYTTQEITAFGKNFSTLIHSDDLPTFKKAVIQHLKGRIKKLDISFRLRHAKNHWVWVKVVGQVRNRDEKGKTQTVVGICQDISLEKKIMDSLSLSNKVFEKSLEAIFILDNHFNYVSVNPSFENITGYTFKELKGKPLFFDKTKAMVGKSDYQDVLLALEGSGQYVGEIVRKNKLGEKIYLHLSINQVINDSGKITHYIGISSDVTQQAKDRDRLSYLASYDALTDLPNRQFFNQQMHTLLTQNREKFAVIRINVDRFRIINSSIGSANADQLLTQIAHRLGQIEHPVRALARISGDDFGVLFNQLSLNNLKNYLNALLDIFNEPFFISKHEVNVRVSVGVSLFPQHGHQVDTLLNRAEQGLKRAKRNGGNEYFIYNQGLHVSSLEKLQLENDLRRALQNGELIAYYQPKVELESGRLVGFEALARWQHHERGLLTPKDFINLAEESGLIGDLGFEMLRQTCKQIRKWQDLGMTEVRVAVNVEARQLQRGSFLELLDTALMDADITGELLEIEITESSLMDIPDKIQPLLESIKSRNVSIALDDFGTGYSSLSYLSQYPFDAIKIDRSFVSSAPSKQVSAGIVHAIIAMGHALGVTLVAEGVENETHVTFLKQAGCQIAQGYLYGKPVDAETATQLITDGVQT